MSASCKCLEVVSAATFLTLAISLTGFAQVGPLVGTVKPQEAHFLYRPGEVQKTLQVSVLDAANQVVASNQATSQAGNDYVAKFHVTGLQPGTSYTYRIDEISGADVIPMLGPADGLKFKTTSPAGAKIAVTAGFASCANASSEPVWERMGLLGVNQVFLMGDTPYVDVTDLATTRLKHRNFLSTPFISSLIRSTPTVGTWDDHDFGLNNGNGVSFAAHKSKTRQGFVEYRAHDQFGTGTDGIYHKLDLGAMEVFLIDPRWFSQTAASPVDPTQKTAFGAAQWQWLLASLKASRAPFKVLGFGEIWQDKKNSETDDMFTYWYERDALLDFIRDEKIAGVVLLGGDIHVSRYLIHPQRVGYDLHDFITSPAHTSVIPSLNVPHPSLEWSSQEPRQFLTLTADTRVNPPLLTARFILANGTVQREVVLNYDQLTPKQADGLGDGLRAWLPFDGNTANQTVLGSRLNAVTANGALVVADGGLRGGAASFQRSSQQYLRIPRSALDDNSAAYTASLWCKPASLPAHGSADRSFLMESTLDGTISGTATHAISIGFRSHDTDPALINLELHTHTLQPAVSTSTSPTAIGQGPFPTAYPRSLFSGNWNHVAVTFDSQKIRLHVNGAAPAEHTLPIPGPISETGGFIIGGHRAGTGRNFDGLIDEVALWSRSLSTGEITTLYNSGVPAPLPTEVSAVDSDDDSLEDWWEVLHGLNPDLNADAMSDTDQDGVPAWVERLAATSPNLNDKIFYEYLRNLVDPEKANAPIVFRHPSLNDLSFRLKASRSTDFKGWLKLMPGAQRQLSKEGDGAVLQTPATGETKEFFRIELEK